MKARITWTFGRLIAAGTAAVTVALLLLVVEAVSPSVGLARAGVVALTVLLGLGAAACFVRATRPPDPWDDHFGKAPDQAGDA